MSDGAREAAAPPKVLPPPPPFADEEMYRRRTDTLHEINNWFFIVRISVNIGATTTRPKIREKQNRKTVY